MPRTLEGEILEAMKFRPAATIRWLAHQLSAPTRATEDAVRVMERRKELMRVTPTLYARRVA